VTNCGVMRKTLKTPSSFEEFSQRLLPCSCDPLALLHNNAYINIGCSFFLLKTLVVNSNKATTAEGNPVANFYCDSFQFLVAEPRAAHPPLSQVGHMKQQIQFLCSRQRVHRSKQEGIFEESLLSRILFRCPLTTEYPKINDFTVVHIDHPNEAKHLVMLI
jgi:hypothetical protein